MLPRNVKKVLVPPIKCQGIKTKLINFIGNNIQWDGEGRWVEPFLGSGVVLFNMLPQRALVSDSNPHIIRFYQDLQNGELTPEAVRIYLREQGELLFETGTDATSYYYDVRRRFNENPNSLDFLFLSRSCFNGVMRFNRKGGYNVPFCKKPDRFRQAYITKIVNQVARTIEVMQGKEWEFVHQDWKETLNQVREEDFIYLDPPYIGRHADYFNQWTDDDAVDLANIVQEKDAGYALSMWAGNEYRTNDYLDLWQGNLITQEHFYHIGATENLRNSMSEALVIKNEYLFVGELEGNDGEVIFDEGDDIDEGVTEVDMGQIELELV